MENYSNFKNEMTEIKNEIIEITSNINYMPLSSQEICESLENYDLESVEKVLEELVNEYKLFVNKGGKYLSNRNANKYVGKIAIKNGNYGFVSNPYYDDLYVDFVYLADAMDKDEVLYTIDKQKFSVEAKVIKVVKRYYEYLVGEIKYQNGKTILEVYEKNFTKKCIISKLGTAKVGDIVRTKVRSYGYNLIVDVIDVLGNNRTIGIDITSVVAKMNIPYIFPDNVLEEVKTLSDDAKEGMFEVLSPEELIFTIDGDDAKDLDDAVSVTKKTNGNYLVNVYIADVSHYVKEGTALDKSALERGTSIYLVDRVIPMLPVRLSNDLCSLNPQEEKLVMALYMEVDKNGDVIDRYLKEGIIKVTKRLSYAKCNDVLENGLLNNPDYEVCEDTLHIMQELSEILFNKRNKRGAIDFDIDEPKIIVDDKGKAIDILIEERGISEKIIEELMILANETVSEMIYRFDLPFIYRIHESPDLIKFHLLKEIIAKLGYSIKGLHPKEFQKLLNEIDEKDNYLKTAILCLMNKAIYSEENIGHFGLASRCYTHFTSPIRRYPDLIVHRMLRKYILESDNVLTQEENNRILHKMHILSEKCSEREKVAIECEFKVLDMKKAEYMTKYLGNTFTGIVTTVLKFGIFVTLENTVDGLIKAKNLQSYDFYYSNERNRYTNKKTMANISLGDKIEVKLMSVNKKTGEIDFELVYNKKKRSIGWKK